MMTDCKVKYTWMTEGECIVCKADVYAISGLDKDCIVLTVTSPLFTEEAYDELGDSAQKVIEESLRNEIDRTLHPDKVYVPRHNIA